MYVHTYVLEEDKVDFCASPFLSVSFPSFPGLISLSSRGIRRTSLFTHPILNGCFCFFGHPVSKNNNNQKREGLFSDDDDRAKRTLFVEFHRPRGWLCRVRSDAKNALAIHVRVIGRIFKSTFSFDLF